MFYKILQDIMNEKNLNISDVARATNISDSTIRSIINRKTKNISLNIAFKLSTGLNVSLERLNGIPEKQYSSACIPSLNVTFSELDHLKKYRQLDPHGLKIIDLVLDAELERLTLSPLK